VTETAAGLAARTANAAGAGSTGITAFGPHIAQTGSESIVTMTIVQIA
jgi:hypothetical protein